MALLITEAAMASPLPKESLPLLGGAWRVVCPGSPVTREDDLLVAWEERHKFARWAAERLNRVFILNPEQLDPRIRVRGVKVTEGTVSGTSLVRSTKRMMKDNGTEWFTTMPRSWNGRTWFKMRELVDISRTYDRHLLGTNHCRPVDCRMYTNPRMLRNKAYFVMESRDQMGHVLNPDYDGIAFTLLQCIERMPWDLSVMGTLKNMPFHRIPKGYLEWLVYDGDLGDGKIMDTAKPAKGNSLRDSILHHLSSVEEYEMRNGSVEVKGSWLNNGSWLQCGPTQEIRKQWERMDCDARDLEWNAFSTFGYWDVDKFVACGTSTPVQFEAHGPATWLTLGDRKVDEEAMPAHVTSGLTEFERREKWLPAESENYDWSPPVAPSTYNKAVRVLFDLHQRLDIWEQRHDHLLNRSELSMNERDKSEMDWEWKEHELELHRMKDMYIQILAKFRDQIPREWGMRVRFEKADQVASVKNRVIAGEIQDIFEMTRTTEFKEQEREADEYMVAMTYQVKDWREEKAKELRKRAAYASVTRVERPAADWEAVSQIRTKESDSREMRHAIRFAKTQAPNLPRRRPCFQ